MGDELSKKQREIVEKVVKKEIEDWQSKRPRWWDIKGNINARIGAGSLVALVLILAIESFASNTNYLRSALHLLIGTRTEIKNWATEKEFRDKSLKSLKQLALEKDKDLIQLVSQALDAQPILMFHGQARLGSNYPVKIYNTGCEHIMGHWYEKFPEALPLHLRPNPATNSLKGKELYNERILELAKLSQACDVRGNLDGDRSFEMSFWARFHDYKNQKQDKVNLLVHVQRSLQKIKNKPIFVTQFDENDAESKNPLPPLNNSEEPYIENGDIEHPYPHSIKDLVFEFNPTDSNRILDGSESIIINSSSFDDVYGGFYHLKATEILPDLIRKPGEWIHPKDWIHSFSVSLPVLSEAEMNNNICEQPENKIGAKGPKAACLDEIVQIRLMVIVNKNL